VSPIYVRTVWVARDSDETVRYRPVADDGPAPSVRAAFPPEPRPDDSGTGITAPLNALAVLNADARGSAMRVALRRGATRFVATSNAP
jgi:hypothetical protein